jgi:hypothetical protein
MNYIEGEKPNSAYEEWKNNWHPPRSRPFALYGRVIVEFAPYGTESFLWKPEEASFNAKVIDDSTGELTPGTEIVLEANEGEQFEWEGRTLTVVEKSDVLLLVTE